MSESMIVPLPGSQVEQAFSGRLNEPVHDTYGGTVLRRGYADPIYKDPNIRQIMEQVGTTFKRLGIRHRPILYEADQPQRKRSLGGFVLRRGR